jgi:hypothetical protein
MSDARATLREAIEARERAEAHLREATEAAERGRQHLDESQARLAQFGDLDSRIAAHYAQAIERKSSAPLPARLESARQADGMPKTMCRLSGERTIS